MPPRRDSPNHSPYGQKENQMTTFAELGLPEPLIATLTRRGITKPFPIQAIAIPDILSGRDVAGQAPTGSGPTCTRPTMS